MLCSFCFRFENCILQQLLIIDHNTLDKRGKNILHHYSFWYKIIQNCLKTDANHYYDNDLLLRQETQKMIACPRSWYNKKIDLMSLAFLRDVFQMTAIVLVSVINHYHIDGLMGCISFETPCIIKIYIKIGKFKWKCAHIYSLNENYKYTRMGWKNSYDDVISALDDFLSIEIQVLQHPSKKFVNCKRNYVKNSSHFVAFHASIGQLMNVSADPYIYIYATPKHSSEELPGAIYA